jgi:CHAT domain-containing protein
MSEQALEEIRAARQELDAAIADIRAVPGFESFLAAPTFADVAEAAEPSPIAYLAATVHGGLALVVRGEDVHHVTLEALTAEVVRERVDAHLRTYDAYRRDPAAGRAAWEASLDDVCAWLWDALMGEVVAALAGATEAALVAGGLLGLLPLHAAWRMDANAPTGRLYALDAMPFGYAPNARALIAARATAKTAGPGRLLAVAEPRPVSGARLPWAPLEAEVGEAAFPDEPTVLSGGAATVRNFTAAARRADVLHLACHGFADLVNPLESGLVLAGDRAVTLRDLMAMELRIHLAVLSACETSLPGTELPDEVVALPTGLLQAGVGGVVASMWAVPDRATAMLMDEFYRRWRVEQEPPAHALRNAQRWLRDTTNAEKRARWQETGGLAPQVADAFLKATAYARPEARDHAGITAWGAFAHVGA